MDRIKDCEKNRMINISQSLGMPVIFIRYNPDKYKIGNKNYNPIKNKRLGILKSWLDYCLELNINDNINFGFLNAIYLFYNEYMENNIKNNIIEIF